MAKNKIYYQRAEGILGRMINNKNIRSHYKTVKKLYQICIEGQRKGFLPPPKQKGGGKNERY